MDDFPLQVYVLLLKMIVSLPAAIWKLKKLTPTLFCITIFSFFFAFFNYMVSDI